MVVMVFKTLAAICFLGQCHPALVGETTPVGEFVLNKRYVLSDGYGGDVMQFHQEGENVYAIHRPYTLDSKYDRNTLLNASSQHRTITKGCVNVATEVYNKLNECCRGARLIIKP